MGSMTQLESYAHMCMVSLAGVAMRIAIEEFYETFCLTKYLFHLGPCIQIRHDFISSDVTYNIFMNMNRIEKCRKKNRLAQTNWSTVIPIHAHMNTEINRKLSNGIGTNKLRLRSSWVTSKSNSVELFGWLINEHRITTTSKTPTGLTISKITSKQKQYNTSDFTWSFAHPIFVIGYGSLLQKCVLTFCAISFCEAMILKFTMIWNLV